MRRARTVVAARALLSDPVMEHEMATIESSASFGDKRVAGGFWRRVVPLDTGCWEWVCGHCGPGYCAFYPCDGVNRQQLAHRWAYEHLVGPTGRRFVLHRCDRPSCVNPAHLFLGNHASNSHDMAKKGRARNQWTSTFCRLGHALTEDNLLRPNRFTRRCRKCVEIGAPKAWKPKD